MIKQGLDYDNDVSLIWHCCHAVIKQAEMSGKRDFSLTNQHLVCSYLLFRVTMYGSGFLSCRGSRALMFTPLGLSAQLRCHTLKWFLVKPTPRQLSWHLNGADMLTRNWWVLQKKEVANKIVWYFQKLLNEHA